jgi:hypothetical protein
VPQPFIDYRSSKNQKKPDATAKQNTKRKRAATAHRLSIIKKTKEAAETAYHLSGNQNFGRQRSAVHFIQGARGPV